MKVWKIKLHYIAEGFFQYSLITYLLLLLAEAFKEGFVSFFFDLNIFLWITLVSGILMVATHYDQLKQPKKTSKIKWADIQHIILLSIVGASLVYYQTQELGLFSIIVGLFTAGTIFLLSLLLFFEQKKA